MMVQSLRIGMYFTSRLENIIHPKKCEVKIWFDDIFSRKPELRFPSLYEFFHTGLVPERIHMRASKDLKRMFAYQEKEKQDLSM